MRFPETTRTLGGGLLAVVVMLAATAPAFAQGQPPPSAEPRPFAWWKSVPFKKELGLTADQSAQLDKVWETTRPELRQEWDELSRLETKLSTLIQKDADEAVLSRQIDRVETARASVNKTRALMLVQMRKVLTPEQRVRFDAVHERGQGQGRPPGPPSSKAPDSRGQRQ